MENSFSPRSLRPLELQFTESLPESEVCFLMFTTRSLTSHSQKSSEERKMQSPQEVGFVLLPFLELKSKILLPCKYIYMYYIKMTGYIRVIISKIAKRKRFLSCGRFLLSHPHPLAPAH